MDEPRTDNPFSLEPADESAVTPPPLPLEAQRRLDALHTPPNLAEEDVACVGCGYNLRGLEPDGVCPECGIEIERSLHGNLLAYSSTEYLDSLVKGATWIFYIFIARIAFGVLMFVGTIAMIVLMGASGAPGGGGNAQNTIDLLISGLTLIGAALLVAQAYAWWMFSAPDPALSEAESGDKVRILVRISMVITCIFGSLNSFGSAAQTLAPTPGVIIIASAASLLAMIASITAFFASMVYIRWLATRIPDERIHASAGRFMWLGPLLMIVGAFCLMLGPLVAMILYIILIFQTRNALAAVQAEHEHRFG